MYFFCENGDNAKRGQALSACNGVEEPEKLTRSREEREKRN
ncbi:hypothetical protein BRCON_2670 [Candidatus Sumerlaea chitinivorans]|uniref:Uncharacterized protein n=1 Tax=Sumerlaea chitinivorans TaxID=2250252 RepID=A0A2Z4Y9X2_SUMC1|nr:hypothetical protein BRCON_2670 [Candidatus Sumerlaea chitinivorans]